MASCRLKIQSIVLPLLLAVTSYIANAQTFQVVSIHKVNKQGGVPSITPLDRPRFIAENVTLAVLFEIAYNCEENRIQGAPSWWNTDLFSVHAVLGDDEKSSPDVLRAALQDMLASRFALREHAGTISVSGYELRIDQVPFKGKPSMLPESQVSVLPDRILSPSISVHTLASALALPLHTVVVDRTGIKGLYDIDLEFAPIDVPEQARPSLFTALRETLNLKLFPMKMTVPSIYIDHISREPTDN